MNKENLYTIRWSANELLKKLEDEKLKSLARDIVREATLALGESVEPEAAPKKVKGVSIAFVRGHEAKAPGADSDILGQPEYVWNGDLIARCMAYAKSIGIECQEFLRDGIGIAGAYKKAVKMKPTCIVEVHYNSGGGTGVETLYTDSYDKVGLREIELAGTLSKYMSDCLGIPMRRRNGLKKLSKGERGYGNVAQSINLPCVLIESGFGDSKVDATSMKKNKQALAKAIVNAVVAWEGAK